MWIYAHILQMYYSGSLHSEEISLTPSGNEHVNSLNFMFVFSSGLAAAIMSVIE